MDLYTGLTSFAAAASSEDAGILASLGIDWWWLIVQLVSFVVLVLLLARFVYPVFVRVIDERQDKIEASTKAAEQAQKKAEAAEAGVAKELRTARKEAADIVATAKAEAAAAVEKAEAQAKARSERIVAEAHEQIAKEIISAKQSLEKDTLELVKKAASLAVEGVADDKLDTELIKRSVKEAKL